MVKMHQNHRKIYQIQERSETPERVQRSYNNESFLTYSALPYFAIVKA
jgi:hypothetical protein